MIYQDLLAYKKGFEVAMEILKFQNRFQRKPIHLLTKLDDHLEVFVQILLNHTGKRVYPKHFHSKLTDSDAENSETQTWLEFAFACKYINENTFIELTEKNKSRKTDKLYVIKSSKIRL